MSSPHPLPAAVLWDMDGTLVDTEPYWFAAERDLVDEFGRGDWPDEMAQGMVGFDLLDGAEYLRRHGGVDLPPTEIVDRLLDGVIARLHRRIPWRPGARELLTNLRDAGVPCALVTMSWRRFVDPIVAALPPDTFVAIVTGDEVPPGEGKPRPTPYLLGAEACGVDPTDCVAIEDSPTGTASAIAAGCRVIAVPNMVQLEPRPELTLLESLVEVDVDRLAALMAAPEAGRRSGRRPDRPSARPSEPRELRFERGPLVLLGLLIVTVVVVVFAIRGDGDGEPEVPPGAVAIDIWAPYWALDDSVPETDRRLPAVREISPFWFDATGADTITADRHASDRLTAEFVDAARDARGRLVVSIRDAMPAGGMATVLADPATRTRHVGAVVEFADQMGADGIDLDYEQFAFADGRSTWETTRPNWVAFVAELADALHGQGRTLTISIPPVYDETVTGDRGYWVYDHGAIAEHVDAIRIMAYDFSVAEAGPIAPLAWVADVIAGVSLAVPDEHHDKLVLGIPSYGTNWVVATDGTCPDNAEGRTNVTARSALDLAERRDGVPEYDATAGEWRFTYQLEVADASARCVQHRQVYWVDSEGVAARTQLARDAGWGGVALWALGYEDDAVWDALVDAATRELSPAP